MCKRLLTYWLKKHHWLDNSEDCQLKKEIWDGKRWSELQWFWIPERTWALPSRCLHYGIPISADHLVSSPNQVGNNNLKIVECPVCFKQLHCIKMAKGSPLNLALTGYFGGLQPFGTSYRVSDLFKLLLSTCIRLLEIMWMKFML